jgi:hypothetical protein
MIRAKVFVSFMPSSRVRVSNRLSVRLGLG